MNKLINKAIRILALTQKEFKHIIRDRKLLSVILFVPIILLALFGYAISFDVKKIKLGILDYDKSEISRQFINGISSSEYFRVEKFINDDKEIKKLLDNKTVQCVIVIPANLSKEYYAGRIAKIQYLIDGVEGNAASIIMNYVIAATADFSNKLTSEVISKSGLKIPATIEIRPRFWYNPNLISSVYLVPGLIGMILILTAVVSVALSIVKEKEKNTIEQINVSPLSSFDFILGKTIPYVVISLIVATLILVSGRIMFNIEIKGNIFHLFLVTLLFIFASINFGIFISAISETQQIAFQLSALSSLLPSVIFSGFVFPIEGMPAVIQILTNLTPAKFYLSSLRAILLKGAGITSFYEQLLYLILFATIFGLLSVIIYRKNQKL